MDKKTEKNAKQLDKKSASFIYHADSKEEIINWIQQHGTYFDVFEYESEEYRALVLLEDRGSGLRLDTIYVFGKQNGTTRWNLLLIRPTHSEVRIDRESDKIIFKTTTDDILCCINCTYPPKEVTSSKSY